MQHLFYCALILLLMSGSLSGQEASDKLSVPFSDASRPGMVKAHLIHGGITVTAYDGKEVVVEARSRSGGSRRSEKSEERTDGMKRLQIASTGLTVTEENNVIDIGASSHSRPVDLLIQVPTRTSLKLGCVNSGDIKVERVQGDIEVNNVNGSVTLTGISGSAVAHALNGGVVVLFNQVMQGKTMSFSSMNGKVDVTFPESIKAKVVMKTDNGEIFSDFDIQLDPTTRQPIVEDSRGQGGRYRVRVEKAVSGTINGGGPEIHFTNFNGNIYIRKAGK
jgi:DUF4097 and DUF4098 domain-containing protein YvlB